MPLAADEPLVVHAEFAVALPLSNAATSEVQLTVSSSKCDTFALSVPDSDTESGSEDLHLQLTALKHSCVGSSGSVDGASRPRFLRTSASGGTAKAGHCHDRTRDADGTYIVTTSVSETWMQSKCSDPESLPVFVCMNSTSGKPATLQPASNVFSSSDRLLTATLLTDEQYLLMCPDAEAQLTLAAAGMVIINSSSNASSGETIASATGVGAAAVLALALTAASLVKRNA